MSLPELLAPAGDYDIFVTAINAGADASYISGEYFGARAFAKNFSIEEIEKSVEYAHLNGSKVHVTVNTLINNFEVGEVVKYLFKLYKIGVDAVIVQDIGIIELIKNLIPNLEVHASTQMTLSDYNCILWANDNNISRVVLPRERNVNQISQISEKIQKDKINMELEVFGHGALCYCFSGNCYISSYNSGRSGNRGACAQPCRKQYKLKYKNYNVGNGYLLSTHDLATYKGLKEIEDAGVFSLKLEGRMKSADYVGTIVNAYRNLIDGRKGDYERQLQMVFNREFTEGYILNQKPGEVLGRDSSGHEGIYIGDIIDKKGDIITVDKIDKENPITLEIGDGIGFKYKDKIKGIYIDKIIEQNNEHVKIKTTRNVREGDKVLLSYSKSTHDNLKQFKKEIIRQNVPLNLDISLNDDLSLKIDAKFQIVEKGINNEKKINEIGFTYDSNTRFEEALKRPISREDIEKQMLKTGDTPFYIEELKIGDLPENGFIAISKLNKIRRNVLEKASELLLDFYKADERDIKKTNRKIRKFLKDYKSYENFDVRNERLNLSVFVDNLELLRQIASFPIHKYFYDPSFSYNSQEEYFKNVKEELKQAYSIVNKNKDLKQSESGKQTKQNDLKQSEIGKQTKQNDLKQSEIGKQTNQKDLKQPDLENELVWVLSSFITDEEIEKVSQIVDELKEENINIPIMYDTPGIAKSFNGEAYGNHNLNVWNSYSVKNLADSGFKSLILSSELKHDEIKELVCKYQYIKEKDTDLNIIIQGNLEVMSSKDDFSNLNNGNDFIINSASDYAILEDKKRKKFKYKVVFDYNKHSHFINKDCLCLIDEIELIKDLGVNSVIIDCRFSSPKYSTQIISLYAQALRENNNYDLKLLKEQIENITLTRLNKGNFINGRIHEKGICN